ncbi:hypothetical protein CH330_06530 [candidate division WOR-3 bacterium JGI_Cruoil_03_51_56]|uniref:Uncharacterized protein n=1 Tax=candidate division WOR-3 bacterium JGI_Cruoil_03_51_56 TaxID=1973747 RepID=A0A235BRL6_UNCW3
MVDTGCMKCGSKTAEKMTEKAMEKAIEKSSGGKAKVDIGKNVDLSDLPAFLRYPGAKGIGRWSMSGEEGKGTVYTLQTGDPGGKVVDWYKASLTGAGWKQGSQIETEKGTTLIYGTSDKKQMATVTVGTEDKKTTVAVMYTQSK